MCYTGSCPYEGRGGGCNLHHRYDAGRVPADAWCSEENFEVEEGMKIQEADARLAELFPGRYRSVGYKLTTFDDGEMQTECGVYVDGENWHTAPTFQGAIDLLTKATEEPQEVAA